MANLTDIQKYFPQATKSIAGKIWEAVPKAQRDELAEAFKGLPLDRNPFNALVDLALIHSRSTFGRPKRVAIIGPANVGKSTLYNQFIKSKTDKAEVSPIPGTTRANQEASAGKPARGSSPSWTLPARTRSARWVTLNDRLPFPRPLRRTSYS